MESFCIESLEVPKNLKPIVYIQDALLRIKRRCIPTFISNLIKTEGFCLEEVNKILPEEIVMITKIRKNRIKVMTALVKALLADSNFKQIREPFLKRIFVNSSFLFALSLFRNEVYSEEEIKQQIITCKRFDFAFFFSKDFEIPEMHQWTKRYPFNILYEHFDLLKKDNWYLFDHIRETGWELNSIGDLIKRDDIGTFVSVTSSNNFSIDRFIETSPFEPLKLPRVTTHISLAAFFGSIKIFKYLFLMGVEITDNVMNCAVAGGNMEIICLLMQNNIKRGFESAIEFRRNEIINWVNKNKVETEINESACINWGNTLAALYYKNITERQEYLDEEQRLNIS